MNDWLITRPRTVRIISMGCVIIGAVCFIRIVQLDGKIAGFIAEQSDMARAASEAMGG